MPPRAFGAVVPNIADELGALGTIQLHNERAAVDPLHPDFLSILLEPATACRVYRKRKAWRAQAIALAELIERAMDKHWRTAGSVHRLAYSWRDREATVLCDYPAWAHRAARKLLREASSIFQHAGGAGPDAGVLSYLARSLSGESARVTDSQLLAGLAIREAVFAARELVDAVCKVEREKVVQLWMDEAEQERWQGRRTRARDAQPGDFEAAKIAMDCEDLDSDVKRAIDSAALKYLYPVLDHITERRIHAEQLLLLADIVATGGMSGKQAAQTLSDLSRARAEGAAALDGREKAEDELAARLESERQAKAASKLKMGDISRKAGAQERRRIREIAFAFKAENPRYKADLLCDDVATAFNAERGLADDERGISGRSVKRFLTKKLSLELTGRVKAYAQESGWSGAQPPAPAICERVAEWVTRDGYLHPAKGIENDAITPWCIRYILANS